MEQPERQKTLKAVLHYFYQDNTRSGSHCRYSLQYHLVWIPKYRRSFLVGELAERPKQILKEIAHDYRIRIIAMEVMPDHVYMWSHFMRCGFHFMGKLTLRPGLGRLGMSPAGPC